MLISEAKEKYPDTDDVINIRIDLHKIEYNSRRTTFNYTASALAVKYTTAIPVEIKPTYTQNIENHVTNQAGPSPEGSSAGSANEPAHVPVNVTVYVPPLTPPPPAPTQTVTVYAAPLPQYMVSPVSEVRLIPSSLTPQPDMTYKLQVGAYSHAQNALDAFTRLKGVGLNPSNERAEDVLYHVVIFGVSGTEVQSVKEKFGMAGFSEALIWEE
jgi:cell division protein FtsN